MHGESVHTQRLNSRTEGSTEATIGRIKTKQSERGKQSDYYGRPLSVSGRPCYILPMFLFIYLFLWPPYSPAQVNGGSRNFYTWCSLSVIREVTTLIFSWSSLNYKVGQKVTMAYFETPPANFLLSRPDAGEYCNSEKNLLSTDGCYTRVSRFGELWRTNP